jgi:hypothetical protein
MQFTALDQFSAFWYNCVDAEEKNRTEREEV